MEELEADDPLLAEEFELVIAGVDIELVSFAVRLVLESPEAVIVFLVLTGEQEVEELVATDMLVEFNKALLVDTMVGKDVSPVDELVVVPPGFADSA